MNTVTSSSQCSGAVSNDLELMLRRPVRQKRLRTSFKHHELRVMKSYFALNHNPDAKDLKQLSIKTGLSKRVLQVSDVFTCQLMIREILRQTKKFTLPDSFGDPAKITFELTLANIIFARIMLDYLSTNCSVSSKLCQIDLRINANVK